MRVSIDLEGEVVDLRVAIHVVHDGVHILDVRVNFEGPLEPLEPELELIIWVRDLDFLDAQLLVLVAHNLDSGLSVGAQQSEAAGQNHNGVTADDVPPGGSVRDFVEMGSPVLVADPWGTVGDDSNLGEDLGLVDINEGDAGESAAETDAGDVEEVQAGLGLHGSEIGHNVASDAAPHVVVGLLDLAVLAGVLIDDLG